jgi:hypothetical protein
MWKYHQFWFVYFSKFSLFCFFFKFFESILNFFPSSFEYLLTLSSPTNCTAWRDSVLFSCLGSPCLYSEILTQHENISESLALARQYILTRLKAACLQMSQNITRKWNLREKSIKILRKVKIFKIQVII